jgi:hypothetical protein
MEEEKKGEDAGLWLCACVRSHCCGAVSSLADSLFALVIKAKLWPQSLVVALRRSFRDTREINSSSWDLSPDRKKKENKKENFEGITSQKIVRGAKKEQLGRGEEQRRNDTALHNERMQDDFPFSLAKLGTPSPGSFYNSPFVRFVVLFARAQSIVYWPTTPTQESEGWCYSRAVRSRPSPTCTSVFLVRYTLLARSSVDLHWPGK